MGELLKPLDYVCADIIRMWLRKASQGRGGRIIDGAPWVKISADDMLGYLEYRGIAASYKQVQRSLRRISDQNVFSRTKLSQSKWDHSYWWSFSCPSGRSEEEKAGVRRSDADELLEQSFSEHPEGHCVTPLNTPPLTPLSNSSSFSEDGERETGESEEREDVRSPEVEVVAMFAPGLPEALGGTCGSGGVGPITHAVGDASQAPKSSYERVRELAARYTPSERSGPTIVEASGKRYVVSDGQCGPLR